MRLSKILVADDYVVKPFSLPILYRKIKTVAIDNLLSNEAKHSMKKSCVEMKLQKTGMGLQIIEEIVKLHKLKYETRHDDQCVVFVIYKD